MEKLNTESIDYFGQIIGWFVDFFKTSIESWWILFLLVMVCVFILLGIGFVLQALIKRGSP